MPADRRWPANRARRCRGRAIAPPPAQVVRPLARARRERPARPLLPPRHQPGPHRRGHRWPGGGAVAANQARARTARRRPSAAARRHDRVGDRVPHPCPARPQPATRPRPADRRATAQGHPLRARPRRRPAFTSTSRSSAASRPEAGLAHARHRHRCSPRLQAHRSGHREGRLHLFPHGARRSLPPGLHRGPGGRARRHGVRLLAPCGRVLRRPRHRHDPSRADRQRRVLPLPRLGGRAHCDRHEAQAHPPLHAPGERESGEVRRDARPGVGLCPRLHVRTGTP